MGSWSYPRLYTSYHDELFIKGVLGMIRADALKQLIEAVFDQGNDKH